MFRKKKRYETEKEARKKPIRYAPANADVSTSRNKKKESPHPELLAK